MRTLDSLHWDVLRLYSEMLAALRKCAAEHGGIDALGVDTWGVDFALLGRGGTLLGNPRHYRDPHTEGILDEAFARVPRLEIFRQTGIQFMRFNTLFQLLALQRDRSPLLEVGRDAAVHAGPVPLLLHRRQGQRIHRRQHQPDARSRNRTWAYDLLQAFALPTHLLGSLVAPGAVLGPLRSAVAGETGLTPVPVIAPASHDTGSAVAAVPAQGPPGPTSAPARGRSWAWNCQARSSTTRLCATTSPTRAASAARSGF